MRLLLPPGFKLLGLLLGLLVLMACKKDDPEDSACSPYVPPVPADAYNFPVRPGTPAWAALKSGAEMVQACQMPAATLQRISTPGLVATCLDYPLLFDVLAANSLQRGTRSVLDNFNGFVELRQRPQAALLLASRYQQMQPLCLPEKAQRGDYAFSFSYLEMTVAQDEYLNQLSPLERRNLLHEALTKYDAKQQHLDDVYGIFGLKTAVFIMARVMQAEQYAPFLTAVSTNADLQLFVSDVELQGKPQTLDLVVEHAKKF